MSDCGVYCPYGISIVYLRMVILLALNILRNINRRANFAAVSLARYEKDITVT